MLVLVVMEYKRVSVIYVYKLIFLLHTSRSTEYKDVCAAQIKRICLKRDEVHNMYTLSNFEIRPDVTSSKMHIPGERTIKCVCSTV